MPQPARDRTLMRRSPATKWLSRILAAAGSVAGGLYASTALAGGSLLVATLVVVLVLVVRPLASLGGHTVLDAGGITVHRPPWRTIVIPYRQVTRVEVRRGPLREMVVLHRPRGLPVRLRAPSRLWFRDDRGFGRELAEISARTGLPARAEPFHIGMFRQFTAFALIAGAVMLIVIDSPWASDVWPFHPHATALPDTCRAFDAKARRLMPGAVIDRNFSRNDDADPYVERHTCRWTSTYAANGIDSLSIEYQLDRGAGTASDADEAHDAFREDTSVGRIEKSIPIPRAGDEARMIMARPAGRYAAVIIAAHRANVEEKIEFILQDGRAEARAAAMAAEFARSGLAKIDFR